MAKQGDFLLQGEIYGVVSAKDSPPRGSGKTLSALGLILQQADSLNYGLVFNFDINAQALYYYCYYMGYHNVCRQLRLGNIEVKSCTNSNGKTDLFRFIRGRKKIFVLDEAGIFCSSRNWQNMPDNWQANLAMMRQFHIRLWWISQHYDHVDKLLRSQSNYIVECSSILAPSKKLGGASQMLSKIYYIYTNKSYNYLFCKSDKISGFNYQLHRIRFSKFRYISPLSDGDKMLFTVYKSFNKSIGQDPRLFNFPDSLKGVNYYLKNHKTHIQNYIYPTIFNSPKFYSKIFFILQSISNPKLYLIILIKLLDYYLNSIPFNRDYKNYEQSLINYLSKCFDLPFIDDISNINIDKNKDDKNEDFDIFDFYSML